MKKELLRVCTTAGAALISFAKFYPVWIGYYARQMWSGLVRWYRQLCGYRGVSAKDCEVNPDTDPDGINAAELRGIIANEIPGLARRKFRKDREPAVIVTDHYYYLTYIFPGNPGFSGITTQRTSKVHELLTELATLERAYQDYSDASPRLANV